MEKALNLYICDFKDITKTCFDKNQTYNHLVANELSYLDAFALI